MDATRPSRRILSLSWILRMLLFSRNHTIRRTWWPSLAITGFSSRIWILLSSRSKFTLICSAILDMQENTGSNASPSDFWLSTIILIWDSTSPRSVTSLITAHSASEASCITFSFCRLCATCIAIVTTAIILAVNESGSILEGNLLAFAISEPFFVGASKMTSSLAMAEGLREPSYL